MEEGAKQTLQTRETKNIKYHLTERHIYGSARLGMDRTMVEMAPTLIQAYPLEPAIPATEESERYLGRKYYELSNHLGNVLTVITDEKRMILDGNNYSHYESVVVSVTDYSPFGVSLTGRTFTTTEEYRYGFNGQEKERVITGAETHTSAEFWMYDARVGRRWELDPIAQIFTSDYAVMNNNPVFNCDPQGDKPLPGLNRKESRHVRMFMRKEERLARKNGFEVGSIESGEAMENEYSSKRWYWSTAETKDGNNHSASGNHAWNSARSLATFYRSLTAPNTNSSTTIATPTMVNIPLGSFNAQPDPNNPGSMMFSLPIISSGTVVVQASFSQLDQTARVNLSQDISAFGTSTPLVSSTLNSTSASTPPVNVDINSGGNLTFTRQTTSPTGGNISFTLVINASMVNVNAVASLSRAILLPAPIFIGQTFQARYSGNSKSSSNKQRLTRDVIERLQKHL